jgi:hypothetical protein
MNFSVIENFCEGKSKPELCEDRVVITSHFAAVIDGATSSAPLASGKPGGIVAAEAIAAVIHTMPAHITAKDFIKQATQAVFNATGDWPDESKNRPCAAVAVYSAHHQEIWRVCDCHIRLDETVHDGEIEAGRIPYTYRSAIVRAKIALGQTTIEAEQQHPVHQQPFWPFVEVQNIFTNHPTDPMGFGAINGLNVPEKFIEVFSTKGVKSIVLCSDGFFSPAPTLQDALKELERLRTEDPLLCYHVNGSRPFPIGGKYFDDVSYIRLEQN